MIPERDKLSSSQLSQLNKKKWRPRPTHNRFTLTLYQFDESTKIEIGLDETQYKVFMCNGLTHVISDYFCSYYDFSLGSLFQKQFLL